MCANRLYIIGSICLLAVLKTGCATSIAPKRWLPNPSEAQSQAFGAWMTVEYGSEAGTKISDGELIAVQENNVYLLTKNGIAVISTDKVQNAMFAIYKEKKNSWALGFSWHIIDNFARLVSCFIGSYVGHYWHSKCHRRI